MSAPLLAVRIPGLPVGKGRPRARRMGAFTRMHSCPKSENWEGAAAVLIQAAWHHGAPLDEPVQVSIAAVCMRPKKFDRKKDPDHRLWRCAKPDIDNVVKSALDALVRAGVLVDDTRVARLTDTDSLYTARGEGPCVEITVTRPPVDALLRYAVETYGDGLEARAAELLAASKEDGGR